MAIRLCVLQQGLQGFSDFPEFALEIRREYGLAEIFLDFIRLRGVVLYVAVRPTLADIHIGVGFRIAEADSFHVVWFLSLIHI